MKENNGCKPKSIRFESNMTTSVQSAAANNNGSSNSEQYPAAATSDENYETGSGGAAAGDEHVARCVALEKAYVHDVYEQFHETSKARPWPKIQQFLQELEPGSLVCDVGCGSGKYLNVNQSVFKIGVDRCHRLVEIAKEKDNEVLVSDNLALPFRDESFDAVVSVAVIHHFATTERRVCALKELARLLRIGGRLIISVWAMEQRHKKFESQDVLVPWNRPQSLSTPSLELTSTTNTSEEDMLPPYHAYTQTSDSDSNRSLRFAINGFRKRGRTKHKGRSIDPNNYCSSSPSSSSLSSPNETCYSFVRRALQKLAGGRRSANRHRPWFLESWSYCSKEVSTQYSQPNGDTEDVHDLPIELRRIEEGELLSSSKQNSLDLYKSGQKSKSLTDIRTFKSESLTRSVSNVSNFKNVTTNVLDDNLVNNNGGNKPSPNLPELKEEPTTTVIEPEVVDPPALPPPSPPPAPVVARTKPKLVKQKQSLNDEDGEDLDRPLSDVVDALPDLNYRLNHYRNTTGSRSGSKVFKQSSMNEELLNIDRLQEKERVRKNIQKQASLNEDLIYQRYRTFDSLRDSLLSVSASKRFQLLKNGFTNKLKTSTTNIEKVASASIKNGFVRILQGWKAETIENDTIRIAKVPQHVSSTVTEEMIQTAEEVHSERRHSREDGSDSSKDSSLQSDTSVDSEDSFASVIFVPKQDSQELTSPTPLSPAPTSPRLKSSSGPTSPRLKQSSCPTSPRIKQMPLSVYPLLKQPTSPKATQLKQIAAASGGKVLIYSQSTPATKLLQKESEPPKDEPPQPTPPQVVEPTPPPIDTLPPSFLHKIESIPLLRPTEAKTNFEKYRSLAEKYKLQQIPAFRSFGNPFSMDKVRTDRLQQIRDLLNQRPDFGKRIQIAPKRTNIPASPFPIVRRSSVQFTSSSGQTESVAKSLPRLLSLELFNPETDDMDSDSSGISSPDSIDSVISVDATATTTTVKGQKEKTLPPLETKVNAGEQQSDEEVNKMSLLEACANVASTLDNAVGTAIQSASSLMGSVDQQQKQPSLNNDIRTNSDDNKTECTTTTTRFPFTVTEEASLAEHLAEFAEQISESVLKQIDEYHQQHEEAVTKFVHDPYINKLNEEIEDLTKLSLELIKERNLLRETVVTTPTTSDNSLLPLPPPLPPAPAPASGRESQQLIVNSMKSAQLLPGVSQDSNSDISERSNSDWSHSRTDTTTTTGGGAVTDAEGCGSTASLNSWSTTPGSTSRRLAERRSTSEDIPEVNRSRAPLIRQHASFQEPLSLLVNEPNSNPPATQSLNISLSDTSQESLPSDSAGGSITYHRYYHVFREGELDQLIERYVENLHIISSYYDHASWCIVAEKVQVWTI